MVFVELKYILLKKILEDSDFVGLNSAVAFVEEKAVHAVILHFYKSNTQLHQKKQLDLYHKVNPTVLWFIHIVVCYRRLIFACSMQASTFTILCFFDCCDNYVYKSN